MVMTFDQILELGAKMAEDHPDLFENRVDGMVPEDLAVLIYTSGTTGPPKGAMLTHANVCWMGRAITTDNPMFDSDEVLSFLPLCHIFERIFSVFAHISYGYTVNFIESPDTVTDNMKEISPTVGYAVPRIWEKYLSAVMIKMSDATWFKRLVFGLALTLGKKRASLRMGFKKVAVFPGDGLSAGLSCRVPKAQGAARVRTYAHRLQRRRPHLARRAPLLSVHRGQPDRGVRPDRGDRGHVRLPRGPGEIRYRWPLPSPERRFVSPRTGRSWCALPACSRGTTGTRRPPAKP